VDEGNSVWMSTRTRAAAVAGRDGEQCSPVTVPNRLEAVRKVEPDFWKGFRNRCARRLTSRSTPMIL
jgi:hypothetical protein